MAPGIESLPGLGPLSAEWLRGVGISTTDQLRDTGPVVAYLRVEQSGVKPSLNLLWALYGALHDKPWTDVSADEKAALKRELKELLG